MAKCCVPKVQPYFSTHIPAMTSSGFHQVRRTRVRPRGKGDEVVDKQVEKVGAVTL